MWLGMMAWRTHGTKRLGDLPAHDRISRCEGASHGFERRGIRFTAHDGIGIQRRPFMLAGGGYRTNMVRLMYVSHPGFRIVMNLETVHRLGGVTGFKRLHHGFEAAGPFGVLVAGVVLEIIGMIDQAYLHRFSFTYENAGECHLLMLPLVYRGGWGAAIRRAKPVWESI